MNIIIVTLVVLLVLLFVSLCLMFLWSHDDLSEKIEGGVPNTYVKTKSPKRELFFTPKNDYSDDYIAMLCNDDGKVYAYQNELYAIQVNGKWLIKYGVTGKEVDDTKRRYLEYDMHGIRTKIHNMRSYKTRINHNNYIEPRVSKYHIVHLYHIADGIYKGKEIGSWLHVMEMAGHYTLVKYMNDIGYNVTSFSDNCLNLDAKSIIRNLLASDDSLKALYNKAYNKKDKLDMKVNNIQALINQKQSTPKIDNIDREELFDYLVHECVDELNKQNLNIEVDRTAIESEFFCPSIGNDDPINQIPVTNINEYDRLLNDIDDDNMLIEISKCIIDYQQRLYKTLVTLRKGTSVFGIRNIREIISEVNNDGSIDDDNVYVQDHEITSDITILSDEDYYNEWRSIVNKQDTIGCHPNNNGAYKLIEDSVIEAGTRL